MYLRIEDMNPYISTEETSMPSFGSEHHLLSHEGSYLRHVHFHPEADTYTWGRGLRHQGNFPLLGLSLDKEAYEYFKGSVPIPVYNYLVEKDSTVMTRFTAYRRSDLDIITEETAEMLGLTTESMISPSQEGKNIFNLADMQLIGGVLGKFSYRDPVTLSQSFSHSMIYVAECDEDIVSWSTAATLNIRYGNTCQETTKLYIPLN